MKASKGRRSFLTTCGLTAAAAARPLAAFGQAVDNAKQESSPSALRITELKCGYVRGSLFVKVHTNQGIWGCGEGVDAYKLIADSTSTPICAGENVYLAHGFRRMLEVGAVDIIMPDLQKTGLGEGQRIATSRISITCRSRRTWWRRSSAPWRPAMSARRCRTS